MPRAAAFNARRSSLTAWRAVEAQHVVSTTLLVDSSAEQQLLETLLEKSKPQVPPLATRLHWLLFARFAMRHRREDHDSAGRTTLASCMPQMRFEPRAPSSAAGAGVICANHRCLRRYLSAFCQRLARRARSQNIAVIRYESVRDPQHDGCVAVLAPTRLLARGRWRKKPGF